MMAKMTTHDIRQLCARARPLLASAIAEERQRKGKGQTFELVVGMCGGDTAPINVRIRKDKLGQGAQEALTTELCSLWNRDDASTLRVRTGPTVGEAKRPERAELERLGPDYVRMYADDSRLQWSHP